MCLFGVQQRNRRPILVAGLPIRKYLTQMKRPHLKYANAPCQARQKRGRGEGRGRRRYVHSRCAELHFRKAAAAAANAGGSPRASQCGFRRGKPCDVDKFGFGPKPSREERPKKRGIRDGRLSDGCTRLQHSVYEEGTHPQIIARLEMQMNCPSVRPSVPGRPTRLLGNAC